MGDHLTYIKEMATSAGEALALSGDARALAVGSILHTINEAIKNPPTRGAREALESLLGLVIQRSNI